MVEMVAGVLGVEIELRRRVIDLADQLLDLIEAQPHRIVIDDYHLGDGDLDRLIAELSGLVGPGIQIIVAGESRPAGLIGLVPPPQISVLDVGALAFTDAEAVELFALRGGSADDAVRWNHAVDGWPMALAAGAMDPEAPAAQQLEPLVVRAIKADPAIEAIVDVASAVPYITPELLTALGVDVSAERLEALTTAMSFFVDHDAYVQLSGGVAEMHRAKLSAKSLAKLRRDAGRFLADRDPVTAIEILIEAGESETAADVLADHLSEIGVERALNWLYRLPDDLRHRFPPVLAAGRATVEVDTALAVAQARVEAASDSTVKREALYALGSVESFRGELAAAAGAFEAAMRYGADNADFVERVSAELSSTRWLLGDIVGARASLHNAGNTAATRWQSAQLDPFDGGNGGPVADFPGGDVTDALDLSALALRALLEADAERASTLASDAYAAAVASGGNDLAAAGPLRAWTLLRSGRTNEALVVADEMERRLGPRHQLGRVQGALIRERCSRLDGDIEANERDRRRLRDLRATGYGSIEELVDLILTPTADGTSANSSVLSPPTGVVVTLLASHTVRVDGRVVPRSGWKSKKALEVLTALALHGQRGARREEIIEEVWPGRAPDKGRTLLRTALSEIRRVLEPGRPAGEKSKFVSSDEDRISLDGHVDLDHVESILSHDPGEAFRLVTDGLASEVIGAHWGEGLEQRVDRLILTSAGAMPESADHTVRVQALEAQIALEPWSRGHYDNLATLHRDDGNESGASEVERRWFADD